MPPVGLSPVAPLAPTSLPVSTWPATYLVAWEAFTDAENDQFPCAGLDYSL